MTTTSTTWKTVAEVKSEPVHWLWEDRIPRGKLTLLDGEPGQGKSLLALDLIARVSRGDAMPLEKEKPGGPADCVLYNDDDSLSDTIRPRLEAYNADLTRIKTIDRVLTLQDFATFRPALIVIDPLSDYVCHNCSVPERLLLKELSDLARDIRAAVLILQHLSKPMSPFAAECYDSARSVLAISNIGHGRRRLALTKSNLRPHLDVRPLVFQIENHNGTARISGWADGV